VRHLRRGENGEDDGNFMGWQLAFLWRRKEASVNG